MLDDSSQSNGKYNTACLVPNRAGAVDAGCVARRRHPPDGVVMDASPSRRIDLVDVLRGAALAAMAVYHFFWDIEFFALADLGVTSHLAWRGFAHAIAAGFLALVGVSLLLAHGRHLRRASFLRRLAMVAAAAAVITVSSFYIDPDGAILFGILHCIALASVLGLAFLRLPPALVLLAAFACLAAPEFLTSPAFNAPGWLWLGLASEVRPSNDYVPLLPWFGAVLAGIAGAKLALRLRPRERWAQWRAQAVPSRALAFLGRHSLVVYLLHQPVLMGLVGAAAFLIGGGR
ncbi:MAG: DUF1624 domain-containing protein [Pseudorhodoplanes sp.]|nr:DUF1624 domain-containing protein [Pseudorhodoplanes sp.]